VEGPAVRSIRLVARPLHKVSVKNRIEIREYHLHPNTPWYPLSRTLSACLMVTTVVKHCKTYGGAVRAFATKTLKSKDLITVGKSKTRSMYW